MKKSVQKILLIGILIAMLEGIENQAIADNFAALKMDSA